MSRGSPSKTATATQPDTASVTSPAVRTRSARSQPNPDNRTASRYTRPWPGGTYIGRLP